MFIGGANMTCGVCEDKGDGLCDFHFLRSLIWKLDTNYYGTIEKKVSVYGSHYIIEREGEEITVDDQEDAKQILNEITSDLNSNTP